MSVSSEDVTLDTYNTVNHTSVPSSVNIYLNTRSVGRSLRPSSSNTSLQYLAKSIEQAARSATSSLNRAATAASTSSNRRKLPWGPVHTRLLDEHESHEDIDDGGSEGGASIGTQNTDPSSSSYLTKDNYEDPYSRYRNNQSMNNTPRRAISSIYSDRGSDNVPVSPNSVLRIPVPMNDTLRSSKTGPSTSSSTSTAEVTLSKLTTKNLSGNKEKLIIENDLASCLPKEALQKLPDHLIDLVIIVSIE